jgi:hypothetical protein
MTHFPQPHPTERARRVRLGGSVLVAIRMEGAPSVRAKLYELSATGGLLILAKPLGTGDFVEIAFQTCEGAVQGMAEILNPRIKGASGCLQPFRFIALEDEAHRSLWKALESLQDRITVGRGA